MEQEVVINLIEILTSRNCPVTLTPSYICNRLLSLPSYSLLALTLLRLELKCPKLVRALD